MAVKELRPIRIEGNIAYIALSAGHESVIDASDIHLAEGYNWSAQPNGKTVYAHRREVRDGKDTAIRLHSLIMSPPKGMEVDHIDGDGLNNRRANLRLATHSENCANRRLPSTSSSGLKGVSWHKNQQQWLAKIKVAGITLHLGSFSTAQEAHEAYCKAAARHQGKFARKA